MHQGSSAAFGFATAGSVLFGPGVSSVTAQRASELGRRAFIVTGRSPERAGFLLEGLDRQHAAHATFSVQSEPAIDMIQLGVDVRPALLEQTLL